MHGIAALESDNVFVQGQRRPDLCGSVAGEDTLGLVQPCECATQIFMFSLHGNHPYPWMLKRRCPVTLEGLQRLVWCPSRFNVECCDGLVVSGQQNLRARNTLGAVCVEDHGKTEE